MRNSLLVFGLSALVLAGCSKESPKPEESAAPAPVTESAAAESAVAMAQPKTETALLSCQSSDTMAVFCGFKNPEDLVLTPDGNWLIVSEMGEFMLDTPGGLSLFNLQSGEREALNIIWPESQAQASGWGDADCAAPDVAAFSPHGIDFLTLADGTHELLVVNHGKRESVEFFTVEKPADSWQLVWQGCALPPGDPFINDVAALNDGGFFVTHMWDKHTDFEKVGEMLTSGQNTGWVWEWQQDQGFTKVAGSDELMPNGITVSKDNSKLFVNIYMGNRTVRIDRASGQIDGHFEVQQPDNITMGPDGSLWVASHKHDPLGQTCAAVEAGPCLLPYEIVRANPQTLETEVILHQDGAPMGYATVGLKVGQKLYMGSAHGDRVTAIDLPADTMDE
ncbi:MAG: SMP-30/gluconolactonase/LRE family protein [Pseudomonadales bacterium]|nr:SMP-30/gluconolactonase/LRE family protein [Pseudomonadales bacterium]